MFCVNASDGQKLKLILEDGREIIIKIYKNKHDLKKLGIQAPKQVKILKETKL